MSSTHTNRMYDTHRWRKERAAYLNSHPLCVFCKQRGRSTPANVVDHIKPHNGDERLFWNADNWQALCDACHNSAKAIKESRGYVPGSTINGMPIDPSHPWCTKRARGRGAC